MFEATKQFSLDCSSLIRSQGAEKITRWMRARKSRALLEPKSDAERRETL